MPARAQGSAFKDRRAPASGGRAPDGRELRLVRETHPGMSGKNNEDAVETGVIPGPGGRPRYFAVVADGIGGQASGEVASHMAVRHIVEFLRQHPATPLPQAMVQAVVQANRAVFAEGQKKALWKGMGTTVTLAVIEDGRLYLAHVGDSRAYLIRGDRIVQLTVDHTWAQEAIEAGRLTPEEARTHPNRNVLKRYVGIQPEVDVDLRTAPLDGGGPPDPHHQPIALQPGDVVLLCTDGLHDVVPDEQILEIVRTRSAEQAAKALVAAANAAGGPDNISVAIMEMPGRRIAAPPVRIRLPPWAIPAGLGVLAAVVGLALAWAVALGGGWGEGGSGGGFLRPRATPIRLPGSGAAAGDTEGGAAGPTSTPLPTPTRTPTFTPRPSTPTRPPTAAPTPLPPTKTPSSVAPPSGGSGGSGGSGPSGAPTATLVPPTATPTTPQPTATSQLTSTPESGGGSGDSGGSGDGDSGGGSGDSGGSGDGDSGGGSGDSGGGD